MTKLEIGKTYFDRNGEYKVLKANAEHIVYAYLIGPLVTRIGDAGLKAQIHDNIQAEKIKTHTPQECKLEVITSTALCEYVFRHRHFLVATSSINSRPGMESQMLQADPQADLSAIYQISEGSGTSWMVRICPMPDDLNMVDELHHLAPNSSIYIHHSNSNYQITSKYLFLELMRRGSKLGMNEPRKEDQIGKLDENSQTAQGQASGMSAMQSGGMETSSCAGTQSEEERP